jgi:NADH dehydrogenase [ubiquinone] 1 alpha subcomplex assembly factor 6
MITLLQARAIFIYTKTMLTNVSRFRRRSQVCNPSVKRSLASLLFTSSLPCHHRHSSPTATMAFDRTVSTSTTTANTNSTYGGDQPPKRSKKHAASLAYCVDLVQLRDREAYYCGLLVPKRSRDAFFALRAFNVEIASIKDHHRGRQQRYTGTTPESPTTLLALQLRMQWWRDAIQSIYESKESSRVMIENPIIQALASANETFPLTRRFLDRMIDAREADLEVQQYDSVAALSYYAESTMGSLLYLTLETMNSGASSFSDKAAAVDEMAYHAGIGIGITTALRGTPFVLSQQQHMPIPMELLGENFRIHAATAEDDSTISSSIETNEQFRSACQHLCWLATQHFVRARELQGRLPSAQRSAFLTMIPSIHYLSQLQAADYNVFGSTALSAGAGSNRLKLLLLLARTWITGVY